MISATPNSNRSEIYIFGNDELTAFSTIRVNVIAENGDTKIYSLDIVKDAHNKAFEITFGVVAGIITISAAIIIVLRKKFWLICSGFIPYIAYDIVKQL